MRRSGCRRPPDNDSVTKRQGRDAAFAVTYRVWGRSMDVLVENVTQVWGSGSRAEVVALDHFSHRFRSGRFACVLGPSGCGKSTLVQIVGGLEIGTSGSVRIEDPATRGVARPLGADSVMVWQNINLFPWRNVI